MQLVLKSCALGEDATAAVRLLGASKRARIQALRQQLEIESSRAAFLSFGSSGSLCEVCMLLPQSR